MSMSMLQTRNKVHIGEVLSRLNGAGFEARTY